MLHDMEKWKGKTAAFILSQSLSLFGSSIVQYAIIWSLVLESGSGLTLAAATLSGFIPQAVMNLVGTSFIDRADRKTLLIVSDAITAVAALVIVLLMLAGYKGNMLLYLLLAVRSAGAGVQTPLVNTALPLIAMKSQLARLNGIVSTINSVITLLSPAAGAILLSVLPMEYVLLSDVVTAMFAIIIISQIRFRSEKPAQDCGKELGSLSFIRKLPVFGNLIAYELILFFLIAPTAFMTPLFVSRYFHESYAALSLSEMSYSLGMLAGGIVFIFLSERSTQLKLIFFSGAFYGVMMCALGFSPCFLLYLLFNLMIGLSSPVYSSSLNSYIQLEGPDECRGRLFSLSSLASSISLPLGMLVFGIAADYVSLRLIFPLAGILASVVSALFFRKCCKKQDLT